MTGYQYLTFDSFPNFWFLRSFIDTKPHVRYYIIKKNELWQKPMTADENITATKEQEQTASALSEDLEKEIISPVTVLPFREDIILEPAPAFVPTPKPSNTFWKGIWHETKKITGIKEVEDRFEAIDNKDISKKQKNWQKTGAVVTVGVKKASQLVGGTAGMILKAGKIALEIPANIKKLKDKETSPVDKIGIITNTVAGISGLQQAKKVNNAIHILNRVEDIQNSNGADKGIAIAKAVKDGANFIDIDTGDVMKYGIKAAERITGEIAKNKEKEDLQPQKETVVSHLADTSPETATVETAETSAPSTANADTIARLRTILETKSQEGSTENSEKAPLSARAQLNRLRFTTPHHSTRRIIRPQTNNTITTPAQQYE